MKCSPTSSSKSFILDPHPKILSKPLGSCTHSITKVVNGRMKVVIGNNIALPLARLYTYPYWATHQWEHCCLGVSTLFFLKDKTKSSSDGFVCDMSYSISSKNDITQCQNFGFFSSWTALCGNGTVIWKRWMKKPMRT